MAIYNKKKFTIFERYVISHFKQQKYKCLTLAVCVAVPYISVITDTMIVGTVGIRCTFFPTTCCFRCQCYRYWNYVMILQDISQVLIGKFL